jgi:hypothetical protein
MSYKIQHQKIIIIPDNQIRQYDFNIETTDDYISNINFHTHPVLIDRTAGIDQYRHASMDVDYVSLYINDVCISTLNNYERKDIFDNDRSVSSIITTAIIFFHNEPIFNGALRYGSNIVIRIGFWRTPIAPFWITWDGHNNTYGRYAFNNPIYVTNHEGQHLTYYNGCLS